MDTRDLLADAFERIRDNVSQVCDGLDTAALTYRPDPDANSIAWLVWHLTRVHDDHIAGLADREQAWTADGWNERFGLPFDDADIGYGQTSEQVGQVQVDEPQLLVDYHEAVHRCTVEYLETVDGDELDRVVDRRWDPPVTAGVRLVSVLNDQMQHLGQAAYVRGMYERAQGG